MWEPNETEEDGRRRSVYIFQRRSLPLPMMAAFDAPGFSESCPEPEPHDDTAPGPLAHERIARAGGGGGPGPSHRVRSRARPSRRARPGFRVRAGRVPDPEEFEKLSGFQGPLDGICRVLFNSNEFLYVE